MQHVDYFLSNEHDTLMLGGKIATKIKPHSSVTIHLHGNLGAGKTTFSRGFLHALGHQGNVKSPTYTLVEQYSLPQFEVFHFDLYRLSDPEELEYLGIRDYFQPSTIRLIEWPEKASGMLAAPDISIELIYKPNGRIAKLTATPEMVYVLR